MYPNPYSPPGATLEAAPASDAAELFLPRHVGLATFLGSPIAGMLLVGLNDRRLGRSSSLLGYLAGGVVLAVMVIGLLMQLPDNIPTGLSTLAHFGVAMALQAFANRHQGKLVAAQLQRGAREAGNGKVAAFALSIGLLVLAVGFAVIYATI